MSKYKVIGSVSVDVYVEVEAENEDEALEKAGDEMQSLSFYAGMGGSDKLIGVQSHHAGIEFVNDIEYTEVEKIN